MSQVKLKYLSGTIFIETDRFREYQYYRISFLRTSILIQFIKEPKSLIRRGKFLLLKRLQGIKKFYVEKHGIRLYEANLLLRQMRIRKNYELPFIGIEGTGFIEFPVPSELL